LSAVHADAQVLNQQINALLANNCAGLGTDGFPTPNLQGLGPNLAAICNTPQTLGAVSNGGGAASVQGSVASILNRAVGIRLEELREDCRKDETVDRDRDCARDRPSSMRFNPLGLLSMVNLQNLSVSSPLYASTATGGGSAASFTMSSLSRWKGVGLFGSGVIESLDRDITQFQDGYKSTIWSFSGGIDYRINTKTVVGFVGNFSNIDGDFRGGGTFSTNSYGGLIFAQVLPTDKTFVQVTAGYTRNNYLVNRLATATVTAVALGNDRAVSAFASSNSGGNVAQAGFLSGYDHAIGRFVVGPRAGVNYTQTLIGNHTENGGAGIGLQYDTQAIHSLQSTLGLQASIAYSTGFGVLVHQINADYIHEFANSQRHITVQFAEDQRANPTRFSFQNDSPARDYGYVGTGLVAVLANGWQPFINFRSMVGNSQFNSYAGTLGLRLEF
jgi:uncharacterized protein YhjY with autotransporter beta-barrel domain